LAHGELPPNLLENPNVRKVKPPIQALSFQASPNRTQDTCPANLEKVQRQTSKKPFVEEKSMIQLFRAIRASHQLAGIPCEDRQKSTLESPPAHNPV
jgi:hypothetical protein